MEMKFYTLIIPFVITSCVSRTELREKNSLVGKVVDYPAVAIVHGIGNPVDVAVLSVKKPVQASLVVNINFGLDCVNQKFSVNIFKQHKVVFSRDLNNQMSTTIDSDFDQGEHRVTLTDSKGKTVDEVILFLTKNKDRQNLRLVACD